MNFIDSFDISTINFNSKYNSIGIVQYLNEYLAEIVTLEFRLTVLVQK